MRKIILRILLAAMLLPALQAFGQQEELGLHPVTKALYVMTGAGCNVVFLVTGEGILVADSGEKPAMAEKILKKIRDVSDQPIRYLVFTHHHHIVGADGFPQSAIVVAHANTRDNIPLYRKILSELMEKNIRELEEIVAQSKSETDEEPEKARKQLDLRKQQLEGIRQQKADLPQITFDTKSTIYLGGQHVELLYFGPGHTNGDAIIYFSEEKILYIGDLLFTNGWVPRLDGDAGASADNWLKIFERVAEMDVDKIIPGHGEVVDKEGFMKISRIFSGYLTDLKAEVKRFIEQGASLEKIKAELKLPKYQHMGMAEILLPWNIEGAFKEIMARNARSLRISQRVVLQLPDMEEVKVKSVLFKKIGNIELRTNFAG